MIIDKLFNIFGALAPASCQKTGFLTLHPWYYYLPSGDFQGCDIVKFSIFPGQQPSDIPLVLAAVVDDLLQIAGLVALAFVIVGAIKFMTSEGNPDSAANARSTVINALAGLAISIVAIVFVNFIGTSLGR